MASREKTTADSWGDQLTLGGNQHVFYYALIFAYFAYGRNYC